jgi:pyruvate dehydrogenase E1 component alpha subunit
VGQVVKTKTISERAKAYGIKGQTVDGNDVVAVYEAAEKAAKRARSGKGAALLELETYRITGHSRRDPCNYQPPEERKKALEVEPIGRLAKKLIQANIASQDDLDTMEAEIDEQIEAAVEHAMAAEEPKGQDALQDMFVE